MQNTLLEQEDKLSFWKTKKGWRCAVPRDDFATRAGFSWKRYGIIGSGSTRKKALEDWRAWARSADFVADIY